MSAERNPLIQFLPAVYQRTLQEDPMRPSCLALKALLDVMIELQAPDQEVLAELDTYFDRYQAPEAFVPLLASWLDLDWLFTRTPKRLDAVSAREMIYPLEMGRLRELAAAAARFARMRGTAQGLLEFMETATNVHGLGVNDDVPFYLQVWVPPQGKPQRSLFERMLQVLKPAYVKARLITAEDLTNQLAQKWNLPGLTVQAQVQAEDLRPHCVCIQLTVLAPEGGKLNDDICKQIARHIDELTPPGVPAVTQNMTAGVWLKIFSVTVLAPVGAALEPAKRYKP